jgi:hypothetical protein
MKLFVHFGLDPSDFVVGNGSASNPFFGVTSEIPVSSGLDKFLTLNVSILNKSGEFSTGVPPMGDSSAFLEARLTYAVATSVLSTIW